MNNSTGEIICHFVDHFCAAFSVISQMKSHNQPIVRTPPGAAGYAGVQFLRDTTELAKSESASDIEAVIDCGANPAMVIGALRTGWKRIAFCGPEPSLTKIMSLIAKHEGEFFELNKGPVLDLYHSKNPKTDCAVWLTNLQDY